MSEYTVNLPVLHPDQVKAYLAKEDWRVNDLTVPMPADEREGWRQNAGGRFKAVRCGRRWGKTKFGSAWICDGAVKGMATGWFAPDYKKQAEVYEEIRVILEPVTSRASKTDGVIRTITGGRVDFWTLDNESAGRSRHYHRVMVDEGAFTKPNMMNIWEGSILPTLFDYTGKAIVASNTNGVQEDNFFYRICRIPKYGFIEYHAPTINNPHLPQRLPGESEEDHLARRLATIEDIRVKSHPQFFRQEYLAEFVDWSGDAIFDIGAWLCDGQPIEYPTNCDAVFAVLDTASKDGTEHDATGVSYYARNKWTGHPLIILDWDAVQIEADLLDVWLPNVFARLDELARLCGARAGSVGAWIEDKDSGIALLQNSKRKGLLAHPIDSKLTALGKDGRALGASGYHFQGMIKISSYAFNKTTMHKGIERNHLVSQVSSFRIGDPKASKRADDLLDTYTNAVSIALGNAEGF